jgi:hypothetical protein
VGPVTHPSAGPGDAGPVLGPALGALLDELRAGASGYRVWCAGQAFPGADPVSSWSDVDESGVAALGSVWPGWLRMVADELERVRLETEDVALALAAVAGVGGSGASTCERVGLECRGLAAETGALASGLHGAADRAGELLDGVVRRMLRAADDPVAAPTGREDTCADAARRFERYAELLRTLRAEVGAALERLPVLLGTDGGWPAVEQPRWPTVEQPRWVAGEVPRWVAGEPGQPDGGSTPTPGPTAGVLLPDTAARRGEQADGVRIAQLPDAVQPPDVAGSRGAARPGGADRPTRGGG